MSEERDMTFSGSLKALGFTVAAALTPLMALVARAS
jgi:hypothetical protein